MSSVPAEPQAEAARRTVVYEQPLNERMRTFLRLEFLYSQALRHQETPTSWGSRAAVSSIIEILAITARGDPRSDVLKELDRQVALLRDYQSKPGVDGGRLRAVITTLAQRRDELNAAGGGFLQKLRDSEFLAAIKHRSAIPGGTCEFDLPDYFHWLNLPPEIRQRDFEEWFTTLRPLCDSVTDLLWVTRENARPRREVAALGVFQIAFERETPIQLLRITLPGESPLFPEISGSHHRCTIRFQHWTHAGSRPAQASEDVPFVLTTCS
jgi:cell division protein ZapD